MAWSVAVALTLSLIQPRVAWGHADLLAMIEAVAKQIETDPKNATLYLRRGELYRAHIDWKSAESDYDRAAQLDPKLTAVDFCRGRMLFESGRDERAKVELDKFLAVQTNHVDALMVRARVLVRLGQRKAAVADFTRAIARSAEPGPEYFLERAQAQVDDGEVDAALRGLDEGVRRLGPLVTLQLNAIDLDLTRKQFDDALRRLETISAQSTRKEKWLARRGEILAQAGRGEESKQAYASALHAIEALPPRLQQTPAMLNLKKQVGTALAAITASSNLDASEKK